MPKVKNTRLQRAEELIKRIANSPYFLTDGQQVRHKMFIETWILPELRALVPELARKYEVRADGTMTEDGIKRWHHLLERAKND